MSMPPLVTSFRPDAAAPKKRIAKLPADHAARMRRALRAYGEPLKPAANPLLASLSAVAAAGRAAGRAEEEIQAEQRRILRAATDHVHGQIADLQDSENIRRTFRGESTQPTLRDERAALMRAFGRDQEAAPHAEHKGNMTRFVGHNRRPR